ncbi:MAG: hypothetical protein GWN64_03895, partial [Candidatus Thorarchaeota archaeon]|nr:hypothetical protein [Candidatus Thorarchaeota archaeon]
QRAAIKEEYENDFKKHLGEMDKDYEELKNFSLDSGRLFREMSTGRKLMVGIGLALSTLDQNAMSNTLNVIDKAIERDINAQKADYETKRAGIRDKQNKYKMLREKYGDDLTAHHTLSALYRQKISDELTSKLSLVKGQKQKANLQMAIADQKMKINKHLSELAKAKQTGSSKSLAANMNGPLARVLEGLHPTVQKMAIKEMSKYDESRLGLIELKNFFKPYEDGLDPLKWIQTLPGITKITDAGEEERLAGARVFRFIKMIAQEKVTDADYERFKVFAPSANDTKSQIKLKLEGIKSALRPMLDSSYPILRSHAGLRHPIFDEEEPNVKK